MGENPKYKILFYCPNLNGCRCFRELIKKEFDINICDSENTFLKSLKKLNSDAGIICLNSANENEIKEFLRLEPFAGNVPMLSCTKDFKMDFILKAANKGIRRFLSSEFDIEKIIALINDAIKQSDLKIFLEEKFPSCFNKTPYAKKILDIVINKFPQKLNEDEIAKEINISKRWVLHECKKAFNITYKELIGIIWVYQGVKLIERTNFDNNEIFLQLNYSEESNMARDFKKVLGISPTEVRKKLTTLNADQLFNTIL